MYVNCLDSLINRLTTEITNISKWFKINLLSLNIKKTLCYFALKVLEELNLLPKYIYIDNILIEQVAETKCLVVIITENVTWDNHIYCSQLS